MFKNTFKLAVFLCLAVGFAMVMPAHKAAADAANCPDQPQYGGAIPATWGINTGSVTHGFASVTVHTSDATSGQGNAALSNIGFTMNSQRPDPDPGWSFGGSNGNDPNAKIYNWGLGSPDTGGGPGGTGRWTSYRFATGTGNGSPGGGGATASSAMYLGNNQNALGPEFHCSGYVELGPGTKVHAPGTTTDDPNHFIQEDGNNFVLDCEDDESRTIFIDGKPQLISQGVSNLFWISNIDPPNVDNDNGGHWSADIFSYDSNGNGREYQIGDLSANPESATNQPFRVTNGLNVRIELAWHANPPRHNPPNVHSECTEADITDGGSAVVNGKTFGRNDVRTLVRITDDSGQVMVHGPGGQGDFVTLQNESKTWTYTPRSATVHVYVYRQYYHNNSGTYSWSNYEDDSRDHNNCYAASCTVTAVVGNVPNGPGNGVVQYSNFQVYVQVTNTGVVTLGSPTVNGAGLSSGYLNQGDSGTTGPPITVTAPGGPASFPMTFTVNDGVAGNLASCSATASVYAPFSASLGGGVTLIPAVPGENPAEDPGSANYSTTVNVNGGPVNISTQSDFYEITAPPASSHNQINANNTYATYPPPTAFSGTYPISNSNAGDQYCVHIHADYTQGYVGPGGPGDVAPTSGTGADFTSGCPTIVNEPYTHFPGSDVSAGGGFGQSCPATGTGNINTYNESSGSGTGGHGGSGAQFGAEAVGIITGLGSANLRNTALPGLAASSVNGLTFANSGVPLGGAPPRITEGGSLNNPSAFCVPDYFSDMSTAAAAAVNTTASSVATGTTSYEAYYKPGGGTGTITLNASGPTTIPNNTNQTIFVDGNVDIKNNISYDSTARGSVTTIPTFYLIVKGNIHIEPNVTRLDGVYVAQPASSTPPVNTGIINTCWVGAATNSIYNNCKNQLVVNGAFVANKVLLTRSYSSLRYSQNGEHDLGGYAAHGCGNVGTDVPSAAAAFAPDCASEIFNFNPELYMSQPSLNPRFGAASQKFDAFTSLSPVL